jgi:hypothetical protein
LDCAPISGLLVSSLALALMVMRARVSHPINGLIVDRRRYRVPPVSVVPVLHHVVFLAASGELLTLVRRVPCALYSLYKEAPLCRQLILLPSRHQRPQDAGVFGG